VATRFGLETTRPPRTPCSYSDELVKYAGQATASQVHHYQQKVGSVNYPTVITRPKIAKIASSLSEHLINPGPKYLSAVNRVIQYLCGTGDYAIEFSARKVGGEIFLVASDAAFRDHEDRKSSEGYLCQLYGGPIHWRVASRKR
jgi:hypothetical protein